MGNSGKARGDAAMLKDAVLIAGPTASGKSALAIDIARRHGGIIVNADSMQVYSVLQVVTARPGAADLAAAPHLLYGHVHPAGAYSTGHWLREVEALVEDGAFRGRLPIFVGGTGLYFRALLGGLSQMPDIPQQTRDRWRYRLLEEGPERLHRILMREDPLTAMALKATDGQRIVRALEVMEVSGRSIRDWQAEAGQPLVDPAGARRFVISPDRGALVARIERRFDRMVEEGALDEVRALIDLEIDPAMPAMKAIGVPELRAAMDGQMGLDEAIARAKAATRQYSKRQSTWFRNQFGADWRVIDGPRLP